MMKRRIVLFLFVFFSAFSISSKEIGLKKLYVDGTEEIMMLDEDIDSITLFTSEEFPKEISDIQGLDSFRNLKSLDFYCLKYQGDWRFLYNLRNLRSLHIDTWSLNLKSLKFLETLENLEYLECYITIDNAYKENFVNEEIDFSKLKYIKKISYECRVFDKKENKVDYSARIPNFINVKNKPELYLDGSGIEPVNKKEKKLLKQYSKVIG